jgi:hypothetical protein
MRATCLAHFISLSSITVIIFSEDYKLLSSLLCSFLHYSVTSCLLNKNIQTAGIVYNLTITQLGLLQDWMIGREWETLASDPMAEPLYGKSAANEAAGDRNLLKWSSGESASQGGQRVSLHKHLSSRGFRHPSLHTNERVLSLLHFPLCTFTTCKLSRLSACPW